jgi:glycosyl transferase family 87
MASTSRSLTASSVLFVVLVAGAVLGLGVRAAVTVRDADISDFRCFYEAGRLVAAGSDPYDRTAWAAAVYTDPDRVPHCARTFIYPLWTAVAMAPLSVLPEGAAVALWEAILLACSLGAIALISRTWAMLGGAKLLLVTLLWSQPMFSAIGNAQFGPVVLVSVAALAYALERGHARTLAAAWWLMLLKPHITALVMAGTLLATSRRAAGVLLAGALVTGLATLLVIPTWPVDLVRENLDQQQLLGDRGLGTLWTLSSDIGLPAIVGGALAVLLVVGCAAVLPRRRLRPREIVVGLVAGSLLLTPYARPHDLVVLAVCWGAGLAAAKQAQAGARARLATLVIATGLVVPWIVTVFSLFGAPLSLYVTVSVATAALTVVAMRGEGLSRGDARVRSTVDSG